jgi:hypothetical protein
MLTKAKQAIARLFVPKHPGRCNSCGERTASSQARLCEDCWEGWQV